ncbi:MAG: metal-sulfur cluster assembly factor [Gemmatimonadetes bacterium]|nr:MAG: metal-sulfur cluster assembly factor [Gemmatimonadota bacterium]
MVREALLRVSDPEYPLSIVDLGLIYGVRVDHGVAYVDVTFTSIGCPAIEMIVEDIHTEVGAVPGIDRVEVEVVWGPPWTKDKITDRGRRVLVAYGVVV